MPEPPKNLSAADINREFRITALTLQNWIRLGRLRPLRRGDQILFERQNLIDAIEISLYGSSPGRPTRRDPSMG